MRQLLLRCNSGRIAGRETLRGLGVAMRILGVAAIGLVLTMMVPARLSGGQVPITPMGGQGQRPMPGMPKTGIGTSEDDPDPLAAHRAAVQAKMQSDDRQKRLVADTDKLLALATDLKEQVDKTTKDTMSVDVIKKADEIEKLAHSVKERMKG
jgi:hypothetical protein